MDGNTLREARRAHKWTQAELAQRVGVSQTYVSLLESGQREVPRQLVSRFVATLGLSPTNVPVTNQASSLAPESVSRALGSLGYPGFAHLKRTRRVNPAELLFRALSNASLEARLVEALPWVLVRFPELDWDWLVTRVKLNDLQNRLGFVVTLGRELATRQSDARAVKVLSAWEQRLGESRLAKEDAFGNETLTEAERRWLKTHRSPEAALWNLLSNTSVEALTSA